MAPSMRGNEVQGDHGGDTMRLDDRTSETRVSLSVLCKRREDRVNVLSLGQTV
jgi:hypothetical protein